MSNLSNSFSSLEMKSVGSSSIRSNLISTTLVRSWSLLSSLTPMLTTALPFLSGTHLNAALGAQPFNYTDALDALVNSIAAFSGPAGVYLDSNGQADPNGAFIDQTNGGMFQDPGADTNHSVGIQWGEAFGPQQPMAWDDPQYNADGTGGDCFTPKLQNLETDLHCPCNEHSIPSSADPWLWCFGCWSLRSCGDRS